MAKILILTGDAGESLEVMYPLQRMKEEGFDMDLAAPEKKKIQLVVHDFEDGFDTYTEKLGYKVQADIAFKDVDPSQYDALIIPGGRAPEYIRNDKDFIRIVQYFFEKNAPVAELCHAPLGLAAAGVLHGRKTAAYPALAPDVTIAGGTFVDAAVVVDGNLISSRAWPDHPQWMREFIKLLHERDIK
ncbi:intracellular proteinase I [Ferroplasma acidiphilum]|uniref:Intracellular proteinase I n=1 Tax=Ferroplasma acidiphilum TaxID=74969 RepID=A0A1V0N3F9_9ARCH|nr:DJ-1/PfpI family protein [Ferroplasma acidiphilum]ARD84678.1 intracellular proteinase I [Ferroplasma acidiphilum]